MDTFYTPEEETKNDNPQFWKWVAICFGIAASIWIVTYFCSCNTPRKAARIFDKPKNFVPAATYCNTRFPVKPVSEHTTEVDSEAIINGHPIIVYHTDTLHGGDSIYTYTDTVYSPKTIIKYKTIHTVDSFESTAKIAIADRKTDSVQSVIYNTKIELQKQTIKNDFVIKKLDWWRMACLITWGVVLLYFLAIIGKAKFPFKLFGFIALMGLGINANAQTDTLKLWSEYRYGLVVAENINLKTELNTYKNSHWISNQAFWLCNVFCVVLYMVFISFILKRLKKTEN